MSKLEDESTVWDERVIGDVHQRFGYVDKKEYRARLLQERENSQVVMQPFVIWFQRVMKGTERTARNYGALVWKVLRETENQPMHFIGDTTQAFYSRKTARTAMRNFCTFLLQDEGTSETDKDWAKGTLQALMMPLPKSVDLESTEDGEPPKKRKPTRQGRPLYPEEYEAIVRGWREHCMKTSVPIPRYAAGMIILASGISFREACLLTQDDIAHLEKTGKLRITTWKTTKNRVIPIKGLKRELRLVLDMPITWETMADLIAPTSAVRNRVNHAALLMHQSLTKRTGAKVGIPKGRFIVRLRMFLAYSAWLRGEPILAQQYLGYASIRKVNQAIQGLVSGDFCQEEWDKSRYVTEDA